MHKNVPYGKWFDSDKTLDPEEYHSFSNPILISETIEQEWQHEFCLSFPNIRANILRPKSIEIEFLNEEGDQEK
jgi:peptide deformylase